jgi:hypothetical protein
MKATSESALKSKTTAENGYQRIHGYIEYQVENVDNPMRKKLDEFERWRDDLYSLSIYVDKYVSRCGRAAKFEKFKDIVVPKDAVVYMKDPATGVAKVSESASDENVKTASKPRVASKPEGEEPAPLTESNAPSSEGTSPLGHSATFQEDLVKTIVTVLASVIKPDMLNPALTERLNIPDLSQSQPPVANSSSNSGNSSNKTARSGVEASNSQNNSQPKEAEPEDPQPTRKKAELMPRADVEALMADEHRTSVPRAGRVGFLKAQKSFMKKCCDYYIKKYKETQKADPKKITDIDELAYASAMTISDYLDVRFNPKYSTPNFKFDDSKLVQYCLSLMMWLRAFSRNEGKFPQEYAAVFDYWLKDVKAKKVDYVLPKDANAIYYKYFAGKEDSDVRVTVDFDKDMIPVYCAFLAIFPEFVNISDRSKFDPIDRWYTTLSSDSYHKFIRIYLGNGYMNRLTYLCTSYDDNDQLHYHFDTVFRDKSSVADALRKESKRLSQMYVDDIVISDMTLMPDTLVDAFDLRSRVIREVNTYGGNSDPALEESPNLATMRKCPIYSNLYTLPNVLLDDNVLGVSPMGFNPSDVS